MGAKLARGARRERLQSALRPNLQPGRLTRKYARPVRYASQRAAEQRAAQSAVRMCRPPPQFDPWITSTALAFLDGHLKGLPGARAYLAWANLQIVSAGKATISGR